MNDFEHQFTALLAGDLGEGAAESWLCALADRGETAADLVTAARILRAQAIPAGPFPGAVDLCGTGGDATGTVNVSTAAAFVVAACGVPVAKHGNRAASSRSGSSDVLAALGIAIATDAARAAHQVQTYGLTFLSAPAFHPALAALAPLRKRIGRRTIFNLLGPLINPAGVTRHLLGVSAPSLLAVFAEALKQLGSQTAWVVHGGGLDELTVTGLSDAAVLQSGSVSRQRIDPASLGLKQWQLVDLQGDGPEQNALALESVLRGASGAYRDITLLNAGAAIVSGGKAETLLEGIDKARSSIDSGAALDLLQRLRHD